MTDWTGPATKLTLATFNFQDGGWGRPHGDYRDLPLLGDLVGTDPWDAACQRLADLNHALTEAGRHLKALPAGPVTDDERYGLGALVASLCAQIPELTGRIERLFDDTGQAAVPVPAPVTEETDEQHTPPEAPGGEGRSQRQPERRG